jgi:hypothetical protein
MKKILGFKRVILVMFALITLTPSAGAHLDELECMALEYTIQSLWEEDWEGNAREITLLTAIWDINCYAAY